MKRFILISTLAIISSTYSNAKAPTEHKDLNVLAQAETLFTNGNYSEALEEFTKYAKKGNLQAIYNLGYMYETGIGAKKSDIQSITYYKMAAKEGFAPANFKLGKIYLDGSNNQQQNIPLAKKYLEFASKGGMELATVGLSEVLLAEHRQDSTKTALNLLAPLIKKGQVDATYLRALYDLNNGKETDNLKDIETGIKALDSSAMKGHVPSLMVLGNFYATGTFVNKDLAKAKDIFTVLDKAQIPIAKKLLEEVNLEISETTTTHTKNPNDQTP